jgi:para-nitrobenzyl esterase
MQPLRWFAVSALLAALISPMAAQVKTPIPPIRTSGGLVAGKVLPSGVKAWLGIPYVKAPVGDLRWRTPQPSSWEGLYNADRTMPECIQILRPHDINHYFGEEATSEDCLYMNIWAPPSATSASRLPVIVFIYGGGSTVGSSGMALYSGEQVARRGAVYVNFNYRLGILGLMAHPALTRESDGKASGNWAYLDQVAALQWIQRNIAAFGGDPAKVVISGQSAGAGAVSLLQASPLAKGLFRGVLAMSGGTWGNGGTGGTPLADAEKIGLQIQETLKATSLAAMRNVPADRLLALQAETQLGATGGGPIRVGTSIDGRFLPDAPAALFAAHRNSDVPVIAGFANDESTNALRQAKTVAEYTAAAERVYGARAAEFLTLYPVASDADVPEMAKTAAREGAVLRTARNWAIAQATWNTSPTYIYDLVRVHPFNPDVLAADRVDQIGAYHTSDVPYWFGTMDAFNLFRPMRLWQPYDRELSEKMTAALMAFAKTGNPNTPDVRWPAWTAAHEQLLEFGAHAIAAAPMNTARLDFMAAQPARGRGAAPPRGLPGQPRD